MSAPAPRPVVTLAPFALMLRLAAAVVFVVAAVFGFAGGHELGETLGLLAAGLALLALSLA